MKTKSAECIEAEKRFEEIYRKQSLCLDDERFKKEERFLFVYIYYIAGIFAQRMCSNVKELCGFWAFKKCSFKLKDGYIIGSVFDYIRFRSMVKRINRFIETTLKNESKSDDIIIAKISQEEIEKVKDKFKITKLF